MANILVTGGAGFIGSHLVETLVAKGHKITVLDNLSSGKIENIAKVLDQIKLVKGSILSAEIISQAMAGVDYVFHLAAFGNATQSISDPHKVHHQNVTGTMRLLVAAKDEGVKRVILASSSTVYGDLSNPLFSESAKKVPLTPYAVTKSTCEEYARIFSELYDLETVSLRYFNVYGPRENLESGQASVVTKFISKLKKGDRPIIYGDGTQTRDFIHVNDVVSANLAAMQVDKSSGQSYNVGSGQKTTINDLLQIISRQLQKPFNPEYQEEETGQKNSTANTQQALEKLGFAASIELEDGIKLIIEKHQVRY